MLEITFYFKSAFFLNSKPSATSRKLITLEIEFGETLKF